MFVGPCLKSGLRVIGDLSSVKGVGRVSMMWAVWMEVWVIRLIVATMLSLVV